MSWATPRRTSLPCGSKLWCNSGSAPPREGGAIPVFTLDRRSPMASLIGQQPRYMQLAQTLLNEIQSGTYPLGGQLPTEFELCEQFGMSRFTVREAIKQLVQMGLLSRQPRLGTRIVATAPVGGYRQVMGGVTDLRQYTAETELDIESTELVELEPAIAALVDARPGERWLHALGVRRTPDQRAPICFTEVFVHPAFR